jgi:hypothetical protein
MSNFKKMSNYLYGMLIIAFLLFFYIIDYNNVGACAFKETYKKKEIMGIVNSKFIDEQNHGYKTIRLGVNLDKNILLNNDVDAFNYIQEGDSIFKPINSLKLSIFRSGKNKQIDLTLGCKE